MIKIFCLLPILFLLNNTASSQATPKAKLHVNAGVSLSMPVYNLDQSTVGGGADLLLLYGISRAVSLTGGVGFTVLPGKDNFPSTAIVPIRLGLRYFPTSRIYAGVQSGIGIYTILKASASHFAYQASTGYFITKKLETGFFYDGFSNNKTSFGYFGIRAGYRF